LPRRSNISIRKTLEIIRESYSFSKNDFKNETNFGKEFALERVEAARSLEKFFNLQLLKKLRLIVIGSCNSSRHQRFMRDRFFKNEISENIFQKFHDQ